MQPQAAVGLLAVTAAFTLPPVLVAGGVGVVLGPWAGFGLLAAVCLARACATHTLGRMLGREAVRRVAPCGLNRLSRRLGSGSFSELVEAHWLGGASYSLVNLVSGGSGVPLAAHLRKLARAR
jgi:phospholipase D1/2